MLSAVLLLVLLQAAATQAANPESRFGREIKMDVQLDAAFLAAADTNHDGALDLNEFTAEFDRRIDAMIAGDVEAQRKIKPADRAKMREGMIAPGFRGMDKNSDGLLTKDEVKSFSR
ncbi:hypothetical protein KZ820_06935 [Sphingomonas sp. RRHST34]|uniref:EF-hand domain-containing protein n=1 Tax=Sphingomonas citri TaxID=2862499 RepID=A0ABS7BLJ5_9SPHN|nr:hypothetical protein [Sphingomonas citri]MBW6530466.1 hypothetical protein [Sphingomonas citri]